MVMRFSLRSTGGRSVLSYRDGFDLAQYSVLIVDDAPVNLGVLVAFLESYGLGIRIARSGESALRRVQYDQPDIVLLDVLMPGIDGFETCRQLKANAATKGIPVIFMTSLTSVEEKVKGFEVGAVDYVTKPLQQEEVLARITTHLQLREMAKTLQTRHQELQVTSEREKARLFEAVQRQREQLRVLNTRLNEIKEAEQKQLARELHDELGQRLNAIQINLGALKRELNGHLSVTGRERLNETEAITTQTLEQVRELSFNLRPPMLDDLGLVPTLRWYVKQWGKRGGVSAEFHPPTQPLNLSSTIETNLYRITQEALTNIAKHANASCVHVYLEVISETLKLTVSDDGDGFDLAKVTARRADKVGAGLLGIRERTLLLDGHVEIKTNPTAGTSICVTVPL